MTKEEYIMESDSKGQGARNEMGKWQGFSTEIGLKAKKQTGGINRNYLCNDCNRVTQNPRLFLAHRRDYHGDSIVIYECDLCVYASKHSQKLARHRRTVHRDVVSSVPALPLAGDINDCPTVWHPNPVKFEHSSPSTSIAAARTTSNLISTPNNIQLDPSPKACTKRIRLSTCKLCPYTSSNKHALIEHIRAAHVTAEIFECDRCNYSHYIRDRFNRHRRYHTMDYVRCSICEFQTIYKWNLDRHMRHHVNDTVTIANNAFQCGQCNFRATTKQSITAHESVHHGQQQMMQMLLEPTQSKIVKIKSSKSKSEKLSNSDVCQMKQQSEDEEGSLDPTTFDAHEFLQLVWNNDMLPRPNVLNENIKFSSDSDTAENSLMSIESVSSVRDSKVLLNMTTKYFYCRNCSFRNEINFDANNKPALTKADQSIVSSDIDDRTADTKALDTLYHHHHYHENQLQQRPTAGNYRCGYCHQTSNWKHVIERHCRLVHNKSALIEKFSHVEQTYEGLMTMSAKCKMGMLSDVLTNIEPGQSVEANVNIDESGVEQHTAMIE